MKKEIYTRAEWTGFCFILLIFLGIVAPSLVGLAIGGVNYLFLFLALFCLVHWDMIFGKLVFDNWLGDLPSIRLPIVGWLHVPLWQTTLGRLILGLIFILLFHATK